MGMDQTSPGLRPFGCARRCRGDAVPPGASDLSRVRAVLLRAAAARPGRARAVAAVLAVSWVPPGYRHAGLPLCAGAAMPGRAAGRAGAVACGMRMGSRSNQ